MKLSNGFAVLLGHGACSILKSETLIKALTRGMRFSHAQKSFKSEEEPSESLFASLSFSLPHSAL